MTEGSGPAGSEGPSAISAAPVSARRLLVFPDGLMARTRRSGGLAQHASPPLRFLYQWTSRNFAVLLLLAIVLAVLGVFHNGGKRGRERVNRCRLGVKPNQRFQLFGNRPTIGHNGVEFCFECCEHGDPYLKNLLNPPAAP